MNPKRVIPVILVGALVAGYVWVRAQSARDAHGTLRFSGNVDIREVNLGFRVGGRIKEVLKDEGDAVKAGEVVARLDDAPYRHELEESKAQVASVRARLSLLEAGYRPQELLQARAAVREREATLTNAKRVLQRQQELLANKTIAEQERDDAQARAEEAEARLNSAKEQLALLEAGFRQEEISQARAELAKGEAMAAAAGLRVEDCVLTAPSDGVVITRALEPGAVAQSGATLLGVSLTSPVWVRAYVSERELDRVAPGAKVEVVTDSRPDKPYHGQVGFVSPRAEFTPKSVETAELRTSLVFRFRVVVTDADQGLRQGMPVTVRLVGAGK